MKSWIPILNGGADRRRIALRMLGAFIARLLLFGSLFLLHTGEHRTYDIGRPSACLTDVPSGMALQPAGDAPPSPDNVPLMF
jgi:hypothetical protein